VKHEDVRQGFVSLQAPARSSRGGSTSARRGVPLTMTCAWPSHLDASGACPLTFRREFLNTFRPPVCESRTETARPEIRCAPAFLGSVTLSWVRPQSRGSRGRVPKPL
jgi:hypothetical protein